MTYSKRDPHLDAMLGKKVYLIFNDMSCEVGFLGWSGAYDPNLGIKPFTYFLKKKDGTVICFRKSHLAFAREMRADDDNN